MYFREERERRASAGYGGMIGRGIVLRVLRTYGGAIVPQLGRVG